MSERKPRWHERRVDLVEALIWMAVGVLFVYLMGWSRWSQ